MQFKIFSHFKYGLYVLTTSSDGFDNGCIINTAMQVTSNPLQIAICVNKANKTNEMIKKSKNLIYLY